jgi:hypothetical protein
VNFCLESAAAAVFALSLQYLFTVFCVLREALREFITIISRDRWGVAAAAAASSDDDNDERERTKTRQVKCLYGSQQLLFANARWKYDFLISDIITCPTSIYEHAIYEG